MLVLMVKNSFIIDVLVGHSGSVDRMLEFIGMLLIEVGFLL